jgi:alkylated DNA repair dioxygenase AlkB
MGPPPPDTLPPGFRYVADFIDESEEARLADAVRALEFSDVVMRGQTARRRVAHFGWRYGYESFAVTPGPPIPPVFLALRERVAGLITVEAEALAELLVTAYPSGAGIGWHRDAPAFGVVVGVSLLSACRLRLQRGEGDARRTCAVMLEPRSAYVLAEEARWQWQHTIPPMKAERYSLTFRTLASRRRGRSTGRGVLA